MGLKGPQTQCEAESVSYSSDEQALTLLSQKVEGFCVGAVRMAFPEKEGCIEVGFPCIEVSQSTAGAVQSPSSS